MTSEPLDPFAFPVVSTQEHQEGNPHCPCDACYLAYEIPCDWCGELHPIRDLEPEEAGEWICQKCFEKDVELYARLEEEKSSGLREHDPH